MADSEWPPNSEAEALAKRREVCSTCGTSGDHKCKG